MQKLKDSFFIKVTAVFLAILIMTVTVVSPALRVRAVAVTTTALVVTTVIAVLSTMGIVISGQSADINLKNVQKLFSKYLKFAGTTLSTVVEATAVNIVNNTIIFPAALYNTVCGFADWLKSTYFTVSSKAVFEDVAYDFNWGVAELVRASSVSADSSVFTKGLIFQGTFMKTSEPYLLKTFSDGSKAYMEYYHDYYCVVSRDAAGTFQKYSMLKITANPSYSISKVAAYWDTYYDYPYIATLDTTGLVTTRRIGELFEYMPTSITVSDNTYVPVDTTAVPTITVGIPTLSPSAAAEDVPTAILDGTITATNEDTATPPDYTVSDESNPAGDGSLEVAGLKDVFPFCIPFDIYDLLNCFNSENIEAPSVTVTIDNEMLPFLPDTFSYDLEIDLSAWDDVAALLRQLELILFIVGLAVVTRKMIGA